MPPSDFTVELSVVICTYNRAAFLRDTLESFFKCHFDPEHPVELLLVDNRCTDDSPRIIDGYARQYPGVVKYIAEPNLGLCHARNTAIRRSTGNVIAFVDDDVYFDPRWVAEVLKVFHEHPEAACMGGNTHPLFEEGRPDYISEDLMSIYGSSNSGNAVKLMVYPEHPIGVNMAFRREVVEQVGLFDPSLQRKGSSLLSGDETDFFRRVDRLGLKTIYAPGAVIYHRVPKGRTEKRWILRRYFWEGVSDAVLNQLATSPGRFARMRSAAQEARSLVRLISGGYWLPRKLYWHVRGLSFKNWAWCSYKIGMIRQLLIGAREPKRTPATALSGDRLPRSV
jgi:GT2 family glycosyltransferase